MNGHEISKFSVKQKYRTSAIFGACDAEGKRAATSYPFPMYFSGPRLTRSAWRDSPSEAGIGVYHYDRATRLNVRLQQIKHLLESRRGLKAAHSRF